jgi:hypothetical protein
MKKFLGLLLLFSLIILNSCSGRKEAAPSVASAQSLGVAGEAGEESNSEYENDIPAETARNIADGTQRKLGTARFLITTASLEIRTESLDNETVKITGLLEKYNSYSSETRIYENQRKYTIKVPASNYKPLLEELTNIGKVIYSSERTEDATIKYYDLESRLNTKRELMRTYQNHLGRAQKMEDILTAEAKIAELQNDIDAAGSEFKALSNLIDYSTIKLELLGPVTANNYGKESLGDRVKQLFAGISDYASTVSLILLGIVIYGIPSIIIITLLYWILFGKIGLLKRVWRLVSEKKKK